MRIHVERIMIKHTIQLNNLIVLYLHKNDNCIEIYRIKATIMLSLLLSYMYICNDIQKMLLIYIMYFRDNQRLQKHTPVRIIIVILSAFTPYIDSIIKKMPRHSLNVCNFQRILTMASDIEITILMNTLIYAKTGFKVPLFHFTFCRQYCA